MLDVFPWFSLFLGIFIMSSSSTSIFICFLTVLSESPVSLTIVLTDGKQDHVFLFAYRSNALYTILPAGVTFALDTFV